jgi:hypothetical protein
MSREVELVADYTSRTLPLATACLGDEYFYQSLPLCVIDAVWSVGVRYGGVQRVVARYCENAGVRRIRTNRHSVPPTAEQEPLAAFCARIEQSGPDTMAAEIFVNRQRTSSRSGVLKAEAVYRFANVLRAHGVDYFQDLPAAATSLDLERDIRSIPGQGSGISLAYFWMLAGSDNLIKPDRMILRFLESVLARKISSGEAQILLRDSVKRLRALHPRLTPRLLDHEIWKHQRKVGSRLRGTPTSCSNGPAASRCTTASRYAPRSATEAAR